MKNNDKAFTFLAHDCSDEESKVETLAVRLQTVEKAKEFQEAFEAARLFNKLVNEDKTSELVFAPAIEDKEEVVEDDIEKNKTADAEGGDQDE